VAFPDVVRILMVVSAEPTLPDRVVGVASTGTVDTNAPVAEAASRENRSWEVVAGRRGQAEDRRRTISRAVRR